MTLERRQDGLPNLGAQRKGMQQHQGLASAAHATRSGVAAQLAS
jgi:hypothetical protein